MTTLPERMVIAMLVLLPVYEAIQKFKSKFGELTLECTLTPPDDHLEDNLSPLCSADETKVFQGLLGIAQWIVLLG
jgi:hypothetical protein